MAKRDHRTAKLLAERMVGSFFEGLSEPELRVILAGSEEGDQFSPLFSMLSYTFDVYLECVSLPEEQVKDFFKQAVQDKLKEYGKRSAQKNKKGGAK